MPDQKPTFNIMDLVAAMGRAFQNPFGYPTPQQQNPARPPPQPVRPSPTTQEGINLPPNVKAGDIYSILRSGQ